MIRSLIAEPIGGGRRPHRSLALGVFLAAVIAILLTIFITVVTRRRSGLLGGPDSPAKQIALVAEIWVLVQNLEGSDNPRIGRCLDKIKRYKLGDWPTHYSIGREILEDHGASLDGTDGIWPLLTRSVLTTQPRLNRWSPCSYHATRRGETQLNSRSRMVWPPFWLKWLYFACYRTSSQPLVAMNL